MPVTSTMVAFMSFSKGLAASTGSMRLYGLPSGPRVASMLARLEAAASTRVRSAARPDALMFIALEKSIGSPLAVRDGAEDLELLAHCTRRGAVLDCVLRELHQGVVGVDAVAVETGSPLALGDEGIDGRQRLARLDALRRVHGLPEVEVLGRVAWSVGVGDVACEQV